MNDKLQKALAFLQEFFKNEKSVQTFDCRNIAGDDMQTIYEEDGITIDFCYTYSYIEIFGLTKAEYDELLDSSCGFLW